MHLLHRRLTVANGPTSPGIVTRNDDDVSIFSFPCTLPYISLLCNLEQSPSVTTTISPPILNYPRCKNAVSKAFLTLQSFSSCSILILSQRARISQQDVVYLAQVISKAKTNERHGKEITRRSLYMSKLEYEEH